MTPRFFIPADRQISHCGEQNTAADSARKIGKRRRDRLLTLPDFLLEKSQEVCREDYGSRSLICRCVLCAFPDQGRLSESSSSTVFHASEQASTMCRHPSARVSEEAEPAEEACRHPSARVSGAELPACGQIYVRLQVLPLQLWKPVSTAFSERVSSGRVCAVSAFSPQVRLRKHNA